MTQRSAQVASLAAALSGCAFRVPDLPPLEETVPTPLRLFVVVEPGRPFPDSGTAYWAWASEFAASLEEGGFVPAVVSSVADVPEGFPILEHVQLGGDCFSEPMLLVLSLGVIPDIGCVGFGHRFDLRRSLGEPVQRIDTHFNVRAAYGWLVAPLGPASAMGRQAPAEHERGA